jgi:hypothetical protein
MNLEKEFRDLVREAGEFFEVNPIERIRNVNNIRARDCILYVSKRRLKLNTRELTDLYKSEFNVVFNSSTFRSKLKKIDGFAETDMSMRRFLSRYYEEFALKPRANPLINRILHKLNGLKESDLKEVCNMVDMKIEGFSWKCKNN